MKNLLALCTCFIVLLGLSADAAQAQSPNVGAATSFVQKNAESLGLTQDDVRSFRVSDAYVGRKTGASYVYLTQQHQGIDVRNALINVVVRSNGQANVTGNRFIANLRDQITGSTAGLSAAGAAEAAASHLGLTATAPFSVVSTEPGPMQATQLSDGGISLEAVPARLVYQLLDDGTVRLAWDVGIYTLDAQHYWSMRVDAGTGEALDQNDLVVHDYWGPSAEAGAPFQLEQAPPSNILESLRRNPDSYLVYPVPAESPLHPFPGGTPHTTVANPADGTASPFGWHDTNGAPGAESTLTLGNNVDAYADRDGNNVPDVGSRPDGTASLDFLFPIDLSMEPPTYIPGAVVNLFYWNNIIHDIKYQYGFDEASGNFQVNNYGNGGLGGDDVRAEAQDNDLGGSNCNANMFTPSDGSRPRMQMYTCNNASPERDGDLDNGVIIHEYTHGTSNRLTGGPGTTGCLSNTEQAGEGWSDWYGIMLTQQVGDTGPQARGIGTYLFGQPANGPGIRPAPYSTDFTVNNFTYDNIKTAGIPHGIGHVWSTMAWDLNWALIGGDPNIGTPGGDDGAGGGSGFDPDFYGGNGGNNLALALVTEGMKQQPCSPGFEDARDGILAADVLLTGGLNECAIWHAFARRGLGFSADQGSSGSRSDGTEAFDLPPGIPADPANCGGGGPSLALILKRVFIKPNGNKKAVLRWDENTVSTNKVDFYVDEAPDGTYLKRTANVGPSPGKHKLKLTDPPYSGNGPFAIQMCEKNSTTVCSNVVMADFTGAIISDEGDEEWGDDDRAAGKNAELPEEFALTGNYPNPFNPVTSITFDLPETAEVSIVVVDMLGRTVMTMPVQRVAAGFNRSVSVDASTLASGTYVYRLTARMESAMQVSTGRMVLLK